MAKNGKQVNFAEVMQTVRDATARREAAAAEMVASNTAYGEALDLWISAHSNSLKQMLEAATPDFTRVVGK